MSSSSPCFSQLAETNRRDDVFEKGNYTTFLRTVESSAAGKSTVASPPPKPLLIVSPTEVEGEFPVVIFLHGYLLYNSFYSQLLQHIASHGFILIAPQLYTVAGPDTTGEINSTAAITDWLPQGLPSLLPPGVRPNLSKLILSGHSRGGKTAFALALRPNSTTATKSPFSALVAIDPVDGMGRGQQTPPPVLTYVPRSFELNMPVMVVGSGLGSVKRNPLFSACAPEGVNHEDFFKECRAPVCYLVAEDFGHLDMLDDDTKGFRGKSTYCLCKNGKSRNPMRRFVGGAAVAFLKAALDGDRRDLMAIRDTPEIAPLKLQRAEFDLL